MFSRCCARCNSVSVLWFFVVSIAVGWLVVVSSESLAADSRIFTFVHRTGYTPKVEPSVQVPSVGSLLFDPRSDQPTVFIVEPVMHRVLRIRDTGVNGEHSIVAEVIAGLGTVSVEKGVWVPLIDAVKASIRGDSSAFPGESDNTAAFSDARSSLLTNITIKSEPPLKTKAANSAGKVVDAVIKAPLVGNIKASGLLEGGFSGDCGPANQAQFHNPQGVALSPDGALYIVDTENHRVRRVLPGRDGKITPTSTIETIVGSGKTGSFHGGFSGDSGPAGQAQLSHPQGIAFGPNGALFITDTRNHRVRRVLPGSDGKITPTSTIETIVGSGKGGSFHGDFSGDGGAANQARLNLPQGITFSPDGALLISDTLNHRVRRVLPGSGGKITPTSTIETIVGSAKQKRIIGKVVHGGFSGDGGPASAAYLNTPRGIVCTPGGDLLIADSFNHRVRRVIADSNGMITSTSKIETIAGSGMTGTGILCTTGIGGDFGGDGNLATQARLNLPIAVAFHPIIGLLIADSGNNRVRYVRGLEQVPTTVVSSSSSSSGGVVAPSSGSRVGLAVSSSGITGTTGVDSGSVVAPSPNPGENASWLRSASPRTSPRWRAASSTDH